MRLTAFRDMQRIETCNQSQVCHNFARLTAFRDMQRIETASAEPVTIIVEIGLTAFRDMQRIETRHGRRCRDQKTSKG